MTEAAAATRRAELTAGLAAVRDRIAAAALAAGRDPAELTLVAVTKTWPASDVALLHELGIRDVGENRDQEAAPKVAEVDRLLGTRSGAGLDAALRWHFIGQLQRNKCRSVASYSAMVHSVDRTQLVTALDHAAQVAGRVLPVCIQVRLDASGPGRGGADPADVLGLADAIAAAEGLLPAGVMAVAPLGEPARPAFARLRAVAEQLRAAYPGATVISAGMSGDLEDAVLEGATHLRVGSAILGSRPRTP
jgi:pyridoxal phosphate enzyme (YggS family)